MNINRRTYLVGSGLLGLRALATGLPARFLAQADRARAEDISACPTQALILSISGDGDPINANAPGTYDDPNIVHPDAFAKTPLQLGDVATSAAAAWSTLPAWVLARTCFFHMATMTTIHPDIPKVLKLMGNVASQEMLPSLFSRQLAACALSVQSAPVSLLGAARPEYITYQGGVVPNLDPLALRDVLVQPKGPLTQLTQLRDQSMDRLHAQLKAAGNPLQRNFVDSLARSRDETRAISESLVQNLAAIEDNEIAGVLTGAVTLLAMNLSPVVVIRIPFGGDNHADSDLTRERAQTESGVAAIGSLWTKLKELGLEDRVTFASLNVFGRTLKQLGSKGRNHWADHQVSLLIGKGVRGGVVGGVAPGKTQDYTALPLDASSGLGTPTGDVPVDQTLSAFGKTLGAALGLPEDGLSDDIQGGKVIRSALVRS